MFDIKRDQLATRKCVNFTSREKKENGEGSREE